MTDGCKEIVPEDDTMVLADGPPGTELFMELIMDDRGTPNPVLLLFDK